MAPSTPINLIITCSGQGNCQVIYVSCVFSEGILYFGCLVVTIDLQGTLYLKWWLCIKYQQGEN
jgi:hypothetical protein